MLGAVASFEFKCAALIFNPEVVNVYFVCVDCSSQYAYVCAQGCNRCLSVADAVVSSLYFRESCCLA